MAVDGALMIPKDLALLTNCKPSSLILWAVWDQLNLNRNVKIDRFQMKFALRKRLKKLRIELKK